MTAPSATTTFLAPFLVGLLAACNTTAGVGKDVSGRSAQPRGSPRAG
ncbi:entericidin [bacterium CG17_big_fil_post_rev_8_21_14_2_50_64_8]|nr:MAG: entericidin [bacterium CG17_big_fil_post_rev_8_21_14_2_50_64_8]